MTPEHIDTSIARALKGESYLDPEVLKITGFSTATMRHLFNNLCHLEGISYLEIGTFCGATFIAASNNNPITAVGIDNFAQDFSQKNVREQMLANVERWKHTAKSVTFWECDAFSEGIDVILPFKFDVLFYDGFHGYQEQAKALPTFFNFLADRFIFIVDDFHWESVRNGTIAGFQALAGRVTVEQQWTLSGNKAQDDKIWWNGVSIFLCVKIR